MYRQICKTLYLNVLCCCLLSSLNFVIETIVMQMEIMEQVPLKSREIVGDYAVKRWNTYRILLNIIYINCIIYIRLFVTMQITLMKEVQLKYRKMAVDCVVKWLDHRYLVLLYIYNISFISHINCYFSMYDYLLLLLYN